MIYPIRIQNFESLINDGYVYVDKTALVYQMATTGRYYFLSRPRRFGKSLLLSTLEAYLSGKKELFRGLAIEKLEHKWEEHPILHLDLNTAKYDAMDSLNHVLDDSLKKWEEIYGTFPTEVTFALRFKGIVERAYEKTGHRVVILVDEYDTPLLEAYTQGYWDEMIATCRQIFHNAFKQNDYYSRAIITGVARISKNSLFSDLNNLEVVTTTSEKYSSSFSFREGQQGQEKSQKHRPHWKGDSK